MSFTFFVIDCGRLAVNLASDIKCIIDADRNAENAALMWCVMLGTFSNSSTAIHGRMVDNGIRTTFAFINEMDFVRPFLPNPEDDI